MFVNGRRDLVRVAKVKDLGVVAPLFTDSWIETKAGWWMLAKAADGGSFHDFSALLVARLLEYSSARLDVVDDLSGFAVWLHVGDPEVARGEGEQPLDVTGYAARFRLLRTTLWSDLRTAGFGSGWVLLGVGVTEDNTSEGTGSRLVRHRLAALPALSDVWALAYSQAHCAFLESIGFVVLRTGFLPDWPHAHWVLRHGGELCEKGG